MTRANEVTIFSNGIADFRRVYELESGQPRQVTLSIKRDHVGDVLASLCVFGDVRIPSPPTFLPANQNEGQLALDVDNVLEGLARELVGAELTLTRASGAVMGVLMGLHAEAEATSGEPVSLRYVVVLTDKGLVKVPLRDVQSVTFEDEIIRGEINKALNRRLSEVKPDATQVQLSLETNDDAATEAVLQYTVPAAAWKISYRLRDNPSGKMQLQGLAVVDNNTEEDWNGFFVSVVTGDPITFSTDLAQAKTPRREHVNVVREQAEGAVTPATAAAMAAEAANVMGLTRSGKRGRSTEMVHSMLADFTEEDGALPASADWETETEAEQVGVHTVYRSAQPLDIGSHRSVIFPVFESALDDAEFVLYYQREQHRERPYRAVRFRHQGPYGLGRGVCTVFQHDVYCGSCIVPVTKPGEQRLLPHALENGVRVDAEKLPLEQTLASIYFSDGACHTSKRSRNVVSYRVESASDEQHTLLIDHPRHSPTASLAVRLRRGMGDFQDLGPDHVERIPAGYRLEVQLEPRESVLLEVTETDVEHSTVNLTANLNVDWLRRNVVHTNGPLANDPGIQDCLHLQGEIDEQQEQLERIQGKLERLEKRQQRLRKNIQVGGQDEQSARWRVELGQAEDEIRRLEEQETVAVEERRNELRNELRAALRTLSAVWQET